VKVKLNLGCGSVRPKDWINIDSSITANIQKLPWIGKKITKLFNPVEYADTNVTYMNVSKRWPYKDNSIDIVYASHLFEHLTLKGSSFFLKESFRTLKPDGIIRIVVPDLYQIAKKYIESYETDIDGDPTKFIMWAINMHREGQYGDVGFLKGIALEWQGYPHQHKFMYDEKSLNLVLKNSGFVELHSHSYGKSNYIDTINDVEGSRELYLSVYLEGKKPLV
jgi:predicted SAM-dependent methyltransferase